MLRLGRVLVANPLSATRLGTSAWLPLILLRDHALAAKGFRAPQVGWEQEALALSRHQANPNVFPELPRALCWFSSFVL